MDSPHLEPPSWIDSTGVSALQFLGINSAEMIPLVVPAVLIIVVLAGYIIERTNILSHDCAAVQYPLSARECMISCLCACVGLMRRHP